MTPLLDEEITDHLQCLELTGNPSASLPEDLADFPHSAEALELCYDSNLRVTLQKVWKPRQLVLIIYLANQNQASVAIHDVSSVLEPPSNLIGSFDSSSSNKLHDDSIGALDWVRSSRCSSLFAFYYCIRQCFCEDCPAFFFFLGGGGGGEGVAVFESKFVVFIASFFFSICREGRSCTF